MLVDKLNEIVKDSMGLKPDQAQNQILAEKIWKLKGEIDEKDRG